MDNLSLTPGEAWEEIMAVMASTFEGPFPRAYTVENMGGLLMSILQADGGEGRFDLEALANETKLRMDPAVKRAIMSLGSEEGMTGWVKYVVADAVMASPDWPKTWVLPLGSKSIKRMLRALHAAGVSVGEASEFFKKDPRVAKEARKKAVGIIARADIQKWFALGVKGQMPEIPELPSEEEQGPGPNEYKSGGVTWFVEPDSQGGLPKEVRSWLDFVEMLVKTRGHGILTLARVDKTMEFDVRLIDGGVQYGNHPAHKVLMDAFIFGSLGPGMGAVLRIFTGAKDELIGEPLKEVRHWFIARQDGKVRVIGIDGDQSQKNHETDAVTMQPIDPEFGVVFCDSPSFWG